MVISYGAKMKKFDPGNCCIIVVLVTSPGLTFSICNFEGLVFSGALVFTVLLT